MIQGIELFLRFPPFTGFPDRSKAVRKPWEADLGCFWEACEANGKQETKEYRGKSFSAGKPGSFREAWPPSFPHFPIPFRGWKRGKGCREGWFEDHLLAFGSFVRSVRPASRRAARYTAVNNGGRNADPADPCPRGPVLGCSLSIARLPPKFSNNGLSCGGVSAFRPARCRCSAQARPNPTGAWALFLYGPQSLNPKRNGEFLCP